MTRYDILPDEQRALLPTLSAARKVGQVLTKAAEERAWFFRTDHAYNKPPPPTPLGAVDAWDEMLAYARSHPADPRIPEALHWLVHVGHFGGSHDHSGHRAFTLLHARYPNSPWAKKTPYYDD